MAFIFIIYCHQVSRNCKRKIGEKEQKEEKNHVCQLRYVIAGWTQRCVASVYDTDAFKRCTGQPKDGTLNEGEMVVRAPHLYISVD